MTTRKKHDIFHFAMMFRGKFPIFASNLFYLECQIRWKLAALRAESGKFRATYCLGCFVL